MAAPRPEGITVLHDAGCSLCTRFRDWLAAQPVAVRLDLVPAGSPEAHARFPWLDHAATLREITVVGDDGAVWTHERAMVMCLWATRRHRPLAERLARPAWLPLARGAAYSAAGLRHLLGAPTAPTGGGDYGCCRDCQPGTCEPLAQG